MSIQHRWVGQLGTGLAVLALLAGCTMSTNVLQSKKAEYKGQAESVPLDVPPDLTPVQTDDRYAIPERDKGKGGTTYSQYSKDQGNAKPADNAVQSGVLPSLGKNVRLERDGAQRWLVVKATPEQLWPTLKEFWIGNGFALQVEDPKIGVMETDWTESRTAAPQDFFKRMLSKVVDNLFSSPLRDKYRTRIERGTEPGTTEIYITHKGMEEVLSKDYYTGSSWQTRPEDAELENEYLKKLAMRLGSSDEQASTLVAAKLSPASAAVAGASKANGVARLDKLADGDPLLRLNEPFDRAWRRVGLALDRSGFTVEDRDRAGGVYFVRFTDMEGAKSGKKKESFWTGLMFWKSEDTSKDTQTYRITVTTISGKGTQVDVRDKGENPVNHETAQRILNLIYEQM